MKGKKTDWTKSQLKIEINLRMDGLDVSDEEFSNKELLIDFEDICKSLSTLPKPKQHNNDFIQDCLKNLSEFWMDTEGNLNYKQKCLGRIKQS